MNATSGPDQRDRLAQVVQNFFLKVAHVVALARAVPLPESSGKVNKWFNLELEEVLRDELRPWRYFGQEDISPLVIETFVDPSQLSDGQALALTGPDGSVHCPASAAAANKEVVLERWIVEFRPREPSGMELELPVVYKRAIVSIRALYTMVRLLPAWDLRQRLVKQKLSDVPLSIGVRVLNGAHPISSRGRVGLSKAFGGWPASLSQYQFTPLDLPTGTLQVGVSYRPHTHFFVEDAESILTQQFLELDKPTSLPTAGSSAVAVGEGSSASLSGSRKPVLSFTRPFRSPDPHASVTSFEAHASMRRTPSTSSVARISAQPMPVPRANTDTTAIAGSGGSSRFSSSFAGRVPRSASLESRTRPLSVTSAASLGPMSLGAQSVTGSGEPTSGLYIAHEDVGDFVKFVDDTSRRLGQSTSFKGKQTSPSAMDASLQRFHAMRASHAQLSDSLVRRPKQLVGFAGPGSGSASGSASGSGPGSASGSGVDSVESGSSDGADRFSGHSSIPPNHTGIPNEPSSSSAVDSQASSPIAPTVASRHSQSPDLTLTAPSRTGTRYRDSQPLQSPHNLPQTRRRHSSGRSRLSFYTDDGLANDSRDNDDDSDDEDDDDDHELLFALSDMHT